LKEFLGSDAVLKAIRLEWRYNHEYDYWFKDNVRFKHMRISIIEIFDYKLA